MHNKFAIIDKKLLLNGSFNWTKRGAHTNEENINFSAIEPLLEKNEDASLQDAVIANVFRSVERLHHGSIIVEQLVASGDLMIVGAEYSVESGVVTFLD